MLSTRTPSLEKFSSRQILASMNVSCATVKCHENQGISGWAQQFTESEQSNPSHNGSVV